MIGALLTAGASPVRGQERIAVSADLIWYGDNTEFRNPFREGETLFGAAARLTADIEVGPRVRLQLGAFGNLRYGSDRAFDTARPVIALEVRGDRSRLVMGTLPMPRVLTAVGPDRTGLRGLLPPIQRETLAFERPYGAGMLWGHTGTRVEHEAWLNWQRLNTPEHRERFDAGVSGRVRLNRRVALPIQLHIVHEGGQLHATGPVSDSYAGGTGLAISFPAGPLGAGTVEAIGLASRHVPDREQPAASRSGAAIFTRVAFERGPLRTHLIVWRGDDFIKSEGDGNYQSIRRNGVRYRGIRDYAEAGVTRVFRPDDRVAIEVSARAHRVEKHYEYSYRVVARLRATARWWPWRVRRAT